MTGPRPAPLPLWQLVMVFALSLLLLCGLVAWLQNVHIVTTNGMYKSLMAGPWIGDFAHARLDPSNYLFLPLYGRMCALLDALGILRGQAWRQFAYLNAFWASVGNVLIYAFAWRLTKSTVVAMSATAFHAGIGFVLLLSVISEDIMPGYVVVLGSMLLAALWFDRPNHRQVIVVAAVFTIGWLIEWRLIFPTLPAFMLALSMSEGPLHRRAALIGTLLVAVVATAGIVQQLWEGHVGAVGLHDLLWTGKGVETGWAGFAWDKAWLMLSGLGSYFLLYNVPRTVTDVQAELASVVVPVVLELVIAAVTAVQLWPRRHDRRLWAIAAVFGGTWGAGEVFNFYSQPQDPQMQVNVMAWLPVAWLLLAGTMVTRPRLLAVVAVASLAPLSWNATQLAKHRGQDAQSLAAIADLERRFPPESTVFVYSGFEHITVWHYALWSHTWDWDGEPGVGPAPVRDPRFKWISVSGGAIRHPEWTAEQHAREINHLIEQAMARGYRVVVSGFWDWSAQELANQLGALSAASRAQAITDMLHAKYTVGPAIVVPHAGTYYDLKPK